MAKYRVVTVSGFQRQVEADRVRIEGEPPEQVVVLCDKRTVDGRDVVATAEPRFMLPVSQLALLERVD